MAINKNFVVKNGLEVSTELIFADADTRRVGILNTQPQHSLHVVGGIGATNLTVSGVSTFSKPVGFGSDVNITGISTITGHVSIGKTTLLVVGDLDVTGNIKGGGVIDNITNLNVTGIGTVNELYVADGSINVGFLTVTGDANLTGVTTITNLQAGLATEFFAATGIQSGGVPIGGGVTTINFTGIGATLVEVIGTRADVYISGGPGISSVGIETSGAFVGTATTINFIGPGVTVGVTTDNVAHVTVGFGSLGYSTQSFINIGVAQSVFPFSYNRNAIEAYYNGSKLVQGSDYSASNGTTVDFTFDAIAGSTVELVTYTTEVSPLQGQVVRRTFAPTGIQTSFNFSGGYATGNVDVYLNGSKLIPATDFTATDGQTIVLLSGAAQSGDFLEAVSFQASVIGAGGSNFLFMDDDAVIGLASTINFGLGIGVSGFDSNVGIVTVGLTENVSLPGIVTATGGFISAANTTPIQISLVGSELTFTAAGIGSTTLTLS